MNKIKMFVGFVMAVFMTQVLAIETPSGTLDSDKVVLGSGASVSIYGSSEYRWRGLNLSPETLSVGISAAYDFELNENLGLFVSGSAASIDPKISVGTFGSVDVGLNVLTVIRAGVEGDYKNVNYYSSLSYTRLGQLSNDSSYFVDEVEQWDISGGVSLSPTKTVVVGGELGYIFDVFDEYDSAWYGNVNGRVMVGKGIWVGALWGAQSGVDIPFGSYDYDFGYSYFEVNAQKSFGNLNAKVAYTYVDQNEDTDYLNTFTDDTIRATISYSF